MLKRLRAWWKRQTGADIREANEKYAAEWQAFYELIGAEQYVEWMAFPPPPGVYVMARRFEWGKPQILNTAELGLYANIANLYWRPLGGITIDGVASPAAEGSRLIH